MIVVFGGTGNYGKFIVHALMNRSLATRVVTRDGKKAETIFNNYIDNPLFEIFEGDIRNDASVSSALKGVDVVIVDVDANSKSNKESVSFSSNVPVSKVLAPVTV